MELFLTLLSGIAWSVVYILVIKQGFKEKTYGMPIFALGLNFAWELICAYSDVILQVDGSIGIQGIVNTVWAIFDGVILFTYFKFGMKDSYFPKNKYQFIIASVLIIASCFMLQLAFVAEFGLRSEAGVPEAAQYSAFLQNVVMSILFINFYFMRQGSRGQSIAIAVAKWIGTLAPTILMGVIHSFNIYIIIMGAICTVFDLIYIGLLVNNRRVISRPNLQKNGSLAN